MRARSGAGEVRGWGGEVRDRDGAGEIRDRTGAGEGHDQSRTRQTRHRDRASDTRDRTGSCEARGQTATSQTHHRTEAVEDDDRTGTSQPPDRDGAGDTRDRTEASQTQHRTEAAEDRDQSGTRQTRDRHGVGDHPNQAGTAETRNQTATSQTHDQTEAAEDHDRTGTDELGQGSAAGEPSVRSSHRQLTSVGTELMVPPACAVDRWAAEARILLAAEGRTGGVLLVRLGGRQRLVLELAADDDVVRPVPTPSAGTVSALPVLPDAATWALPDLRLLRAGAIEAERLHPLVAAALAPDRAATGPPRTPDRPGRPRLVECRGARHRIGLVDGVLAPLDHAPDEIRREELLVALTGTPLPCLQAIDEAHRRPHCLAGVRERLVHGDTAGALAVVEGLLGPEALLRTGPLRDELEAAALRRITYGLFRAGLTGPGPTWFRPRPSGRDARNRRTHPRHAT
nr:hypothetical protein [Streptomyces canus]